MSTLTAPDLVDEDTKSFVDTQKDIKSLHQKFESVLEDIKEFGTKSQGVLDSFGPIEEEEDALEPSSQSNVTSEQDIRNLIKEIQQIKADCKTAKDLLNSRRMKDRVQLAKFTRQIDDIIQILDGQIFRAERLLQ